MKRTLAIAVMFTSMMAQMPGLSAGAAGVIAGTIQGPAGPMAGVRINALSATGQIVASAMTNGTGAYSVEGLPTGTFMLQAVSPSGGVVTTATATLSAASMRATRNLTAPAAAAPAAQSAALSGGTNTAKAVWWVVGASAATAGIVSAVALDEDPSPVQ
jgi:hypothetical protein